MAEHRDRFCSVTNDEFAVSGGDHPERVACPPDLSRADAGQRPRAAARWCCSPGPGGCGRPPRAGWPTRWPAPGCSCRYRAARPPPRWRSRPRPRSRRSMAPRGHQNDRLREPPGGSGRGGGVPRYSGPRRRPAARPPRRGHPAAVLRPGRRPAVRAGSARPGRHPAAAAKRRQPSVRGRGLVGVRDSGRRPAIRIRAGGSGPGGSDGVRPADSYGDPGPADPGPADPGRARSGAGSGLRAEPGARTRERQSRAPRVRGGRTARPVRLAEVLRRRAGRAAELPVRPGPADLRRAGGLWPARAVGRASGRPRGTRSRSRG